MQKYFVFFIITAACLCIITHAQLTSSNSFLTLSNTSIDVGQRAISNAIISGGIGPYKGEYVLIADNGLQDQTISTVGVGFEPVGLAISPSGSLVYVANFGSGTVSVIDTATNSVINTITVGTEPRDVALNYLGTIAYVANYGSDTVNVIDVATNTVINTITVGSSPDGVSFNPSGTLAYVSNHDSGTVNVIDVATNTVINTITVGSDPYIATFNPSGTLAYVPNLGSGTVNVINVAANAVVNTIIVGTWPYSVSLNPQGTIAYVSNYGSSSVSVIETSTNTVINTINVGSYPIGVSFDPSGALAYVANNGCFFSCQTGGNTISVINTVTNTVTNTIQGLFQPDYVLFNPSGTLAYVSNDGGGTVNTISVPESAVEYLDANNALTLDLYAESGNTIDITFNGIQSQLNVPYSQTVYGTLMLYGYAQDSTTGLEGLSGLTGTNAILIYNAIRINPQLSIPTISASNIVVDSNEYETLSAYDTGGAPPYTYNFLVYNSVTGAIIANQLSGSNSFTFNLNNPYYWFSNNVITANVIVTDSATTPASKNSVSSGSIYINYQLNAPECAYDENAIKVIANSLDTNYMNYLYRYGNTIGQWIASDQWGAIKLPNGNVLFPEGDTFFGSTINGGNTISPSTTFLHNTFINANSLILSDTGSSFTTLFGGTEPNPASFVTPNSIPGSWFWPAGSGQMANNGNNIYELYGQFSSTGSGPLAFAQNGIVIANILYPNFEVAGTVNVPFTNKIYWSETFNNTSTDGYVYVYGTNSPGGLIQDYGFAARAYGISNLIDPNNWQYYTGSGWSSSNSVLGVVYRGWSNIFSVQKYGDVYVEINGPAFLDQHGYMSFGCSPVGPFTSSATTFDAASETGTYGSYGDSNVFAYGGIGLPVFGTINTIMTEYNLNSLNSGDLYNNTYIYRPHLLNLTLETNPQSVTISSSNSAALDSGQYETFFAFTENGTPPYTYNFLVYNSVTGAMIANQLSGSNSFTIYSSQYVGDTIYANVILSDSATTPVVSNSIKTGIITVNSALSTPTIHASNDMVYIGQYETLSAYDTGGTPPYTYNFLVYNSVTGAIIANQLSGSNSFTFEIPTYWTSNTVIYGNVIVNDSASYPSISNSVNSENIINNNYLTTATSSGNPGSAGFYSAVNITFTGTPTIGNQSAWSLYVNGALFGKTDSVMHWTEQGSPGTYSLTFSNPGNTNYTANTLTTTLTVSSLGSGGAPSPAVTTIPLHINKTSTTTTVPASKKRSIYVVSSNSSEKACTNESAEAIFNFSSIGSVFDVPNFNAGCITIKAIGISTAPIIPPNRMKSIVLENISLNNTITEINSTISYPCRTYYSGIAPYILKNNTWIKIAPFTLNASSCKVSFTIPNDPIIGIFGINNNKSTNNSGLSTSTISQPNSYKKTNAGFLIILVAIILAFVMIIVFWALKHKNIKYN